jgi:hypothetical protein
MQPRDLDRVETELGYDLPLAYRDFIAAFRKRPRPKRKTLISGLLDSWIIRSAARAIKVNEQMGTLRSIAGLKRWPSKFFVFGEDGCGNYHAIDVRRRNPAVLFYDHDSDEIQQLADSLDDFVRVTEAGTDFQTKVLHSGDAAARKTQSRRTPRPLPKQIKVGPNALLWQTSWPAFVEECMKIFASTDDEAKRTVQFNRTFGGKPACWEATVEWLDLGDYPYAHLNLPAIRKKLGSLRLNFRFLPVGFELADSYEATDGNPKIFTDRAAWKDVEIDGTIRITVMFASGYKDEISCVDLGSQDRGVQQVAIHVCGGHPDAILSGAPPESERNWRIVEKSGWLLGKRKTWKAKVRKR